MREVPWADMATPGAVHAWDALAQWASEPNPFYESWYLLPSLRALDPGGEALLLRFELGGDLAGLVPISRARRYYGWPLPHLGTWLHANMFLGAPLVAKGLEREFWQALFAWADHNAGAALFLHLRELPLTGALFDALNAVLAEQDRYGALVHREQRVILQSDQTPEDYWAASVSAKKRKELNRQANRLGETGALAYVRHHDETGLAQWTADFLALEAAGWKGKAGSALASQPATATLFADALAGAAQRGRLERLALTLDGRPVAMLASFLTPPGAFSYKTAFDESLAAFSPGVLLQRENLAVLGNPGVQWTDSCANASHPMIAHLWRERRELGRISLAIGGKARRAMFRAWSRIELARSPLED